MPNEKRAESPEEWGRRQAQAAPPWSDSKWQRLCAVLRIKAAEPAKRSSAPKTQSWPEAHPQSMKSLGQAISEP